MALLGGPSIKRNKVRPGERMLLPGQWGKAVATMMAATAISARYRIRYFQLTLAGLLL